MFKGPYRIFVIQKAAFCAKVSPALSLLRLGAFRKTAMQRLAEPLSIWKQACWLAEIGKVALPGP